VVADHFGKGVGKLGGPAKVQGSRREGGQENK
jgi:hypothetical protein